MSDNGAEAIVVLPLYSTRGGSKNVPAMSGLNQWNAGGRPRQPGESYIAVPKVVHSLCPNFFPERDVQFELSLPNRQVVTAKMCQSGSKALMSSPNSSLNLWLFLKIDGNFESYLKRFAEKRPYNYGDLEMLGFDSLMIEKFDREFIATPAPIGSFEKWVLGQSIDNVVLRNTQP